MQPQHVVGVITSHVVNNRHPPRPQRDHRGENLQHGSVPTAMPTATAPQGDPQTDRPGHQSGDERVSGEDEDVAGGTRYRDQRVGRGAVALQLSHPTLGAEETVKETASATGQERDSAADLLDRLKGGAHRHPENDPVAHQETAHPPWSRQGKNRQRRQLEYLLDDGSNHQRGSGIRWGDAGSVADPQAHRGDQQCQRHPGGEHSGGQRPGDSLGPRQGEPAHHQPQAPDPCPQCGADRRRDHHGHEEHQQREPGGHGPHSAQHEEDAGPRRAVTQPFPPLLLGRRRVCPRSGRRPRSRSRSGRRGRSGCSDRCRRRSRLLGGSLGGSRFGGSAGDRHGAVDGRLRSVG